MPATTSTISVREIPGEAMCFTVDSRTKPAEPHRVELLAHAGASECSCKGWQCRAWPAIRDGEYHGTRRTTCHHVRAARLYFLNSLLQTMSAQQNLKCHENLSIH